MLNTCVTGPSSCAVLQSRNVASLAKTSARSPWRLELDVSCAGSGGISISPLLSTLQVPAVLGGGDEARESEQVPEQEDEAEGAAGSMWRGVKEHVQPSRKGAGE